MGGNKRISLKIVSLCLGVLLVLGCFFGAVTRLSAGQNAQGRQQLEDALRRAALACYAAEGIYPPDVDYMEEHYGVRIDDGRYTVFYEVFASNLMPEITVLEKD